MPRPIFTIGHSTRSLAELAELLQAHGVTRLIDVRTISRSRHNPQFNLETLPDGLAQYGITYEQMPGLGGLRHAKADSRNAGWENAAFRGYADYMASPEFAAALQSLIEGSQAEIVAIMCAEAVPWRCHRRMIADALLARGLQVFHIYGGKRVEAHVLTRWAKLEGTVVDYTGPAVGDDP
jgi:uncharacterized protein (DUF488 family)